MADEKHRIPDPVKFEFDPGLTSTKLRSPVLRRANARVKMAAVYSIAATVFFGPIVASIALLMPEMGGWDAIASIVLVGYVVLIALPWVYFARALRNLRRSEGVVMNREWAEQAGYLPEPEDGPKMADRIIYPYED